MNRASAEQGHGARGEVGTRRMLSEKGPGLQSLALTVDGASKKF